MCVKQPAFFFLSVCVCECGRCECSAQCVGDVCVCVCLPTPALGGRGHECGPCSFDLLYSLFLDDLPCVIVGDLLPETELLFHRDSSDRVRLLMFRSAASATSTATVT